MNLVEEMYRSAEKRIDATVEGLEVILKIAKDRLQDGVRERWLLHESYLTKARTFLRSTKQLPELRWAQRVDVDMVLTEKAAIFVLPLNEGTSSYYSFFGTDPPFVRWATDLFDEEWQKAKIWYP